MQGGACGKNIFHREIGGAKFHPRYSLRLYSKKQSPGLFFALLRRAALPKSTLSRNVKNPMQLHRIFWWERVDSDHRSH